MKGVQLKREKYLMSEKKYFLYWTCPLIAKSTLTAISTTELDCLSVNYIAIIIINISCVLHLYKTGIICKSDLKKQNFYDEMNNNKQWR